MRSAPGRTRGPCYCDCAIVEGRVSRHSGGACLKVVTRAPPRPCRPCRAVPSPPKPQTPRLSGPFGSAFAGFRFSSSIARLPPSSHTRPARAHAPALISACQRSPGIYTDTLRVTLHRARPLLVARRSHVPTGTRMSRAASSRELRRRRETDSRDAPCTHGSSPPRPLVHMLWAKGAGLKMPGAASPPRRPCWRPGTAGTRTRPTAVGPIVREMPAHGRRVLSTTPLSYWSRTSSRALTMR